ncbi:MAG: hypothetical protein KKI12_02950 [Proteobacteria bacterium]|nr:hypothetical protein [Pseudomonadota bacterium]MBU4258811.1 hypothetical protein [Pseudomonadota bacterium]MBU4287111.1 hypothetical protein [Pseudomonadota bacterium]MCG2757194.1 hypothetical protein [Desulfobacteraceae bacterium]
MGGRGSGNWCRDSKSTTGSQHRIDMRWLKKQGYLRPGALGSLSWSRGDEQTGSIGFRMEQNRMILNYRHRPNGGEWEPIEQTISFDRTPCNYGGLRTWFQCPRCWKRVALLYGAGKYFFCRHCYNLTYGSQQESMPDRLMRKAMKIRATVGSKRQPHGTYPVQAKKHAPENFRPPAQRG